LKEILDKQGLKYHEEEGSLVEGAKEGAGHEKSGHGLTFNECVEKVYLI
jgi:hypothetical protein